jgi:protein gp37
MNKTKIEWCTHTFNPVTGCLHGCPYCYAKRIAERFSKYDQHEIYAHTRLDKLGYPMLNEPETVVQDGKTLIDPYPFGFYPTFHRYRLDEPAKMKKPARIFVVSMGDLFGAWVPDSWILEVFEACKKAPQHKYMFLTKNPKRYAELAEKGLLPSLDNFWYGQTCTKGEVEAFLGPYHQFLSAEPLQGMVSHAGFEWVIIGAESGNRKERYLPRKKDIFMTIQYDCTTFMKDSLIPIIGEVNMIRSIPRELRLEGEK